MEKKRTKTSMVQYPRSVSKMADAIMKKSLPFSPKTLLAICPPSSIPIGKRFNIVTTTPIYPANATGWRRIIGYSVALGMDNSIICNMSGG